MPEATSAPTPAPTANAAPTVPQTNEAAPAAPDAAPASTETPAADPATAPAAQAAPPTPAQQQLDMAPKLGRVAKREAAVREERARMEAEQKAAKEAFESEKAALMAQQKALEADAAEARRMRALKANPLALVRELGMTPQQLLELAAKGDVGDPAALIAAQEAKAKADELDKRLAALDEREEKERKARDERERQAQQQQQTAQYHGRIQALLDKGGERWDFARADPDLTPSYILNAAVEYVRVNRIQPATPGEEDRVFETVIDRIEKHLESKLEKAKAAPKWEKRFAAKPAAAAPAAATPPKPAAAPTLSNAIASATPPDVKPVGKSWTRDDDVAFIKQKYATSLEQHAKKISEERAALKAAKAAKAEKAAEAKP